MITKDMVLKLREGDAAISLTGMTQHDREILGDMLDEHPKLIKIENKNSESIKAYVADRSMDQTYSCPWELLVFESYGCNAYRGKMAKEMRKKRIIYEGLDIVNNVADCLIEDVDLDKLLS